MARRHLRARSRPAARADGGFTLLEVVVAIALVGTVMAALTTFYISGMSATHAQSARQTAIQLANDGMERVRARTGSDLVSGRDATSVAAQWSAGQSGSVAGVAEYLALTEAAVDAGAAAGAGASAALPTSPVDVDLNGRSYQEHWYVGRCWQAAGGGVCDTDDTRPVPLLRVVVAVTWVHQSCAGSACSFVTTTLVASDPDDPIFNTHQGARPTVTDPGAQGGDAGVAASLQIIGSGTVAPLSWTATGLPDGLTMDDNGRISGTPTATGTYPVTVRLTDGFNRAGTASFTWTINAKPSLNAPSTRVTARGTAVSLTIPVTGGTGPYGWAATGLPAGLAIDATSGAITGTPTTAGTSNVTVTVTDASAQPATASFTWSVTNG